MLSAFITVSIVGLFTFIGGFLALFTRSNNTKFLSIILGFSAGAMVYVSLSELLNESQTLLLQELLKPEVIWIKVLAFLLGIMFVAIINHIIPLHVAGKTKLMMRISKRKQIYKTGLLTLLITFLHGLPIGLAIFFGSLINMNCVGISVAIAAAVHNIPKGMFVAVPMYHATNSNKKALFYTFISSIVELSGAILGLLFLNVLLTEIVLGVLFIIVAGMMLYIAIDELLPISRCNEDGHLSMVGFVTGIVVIVMICCKF
ncbi:ZIP family metal transporter [Pseudomonadota bacterium]